ncbi:MAG TPA: serine hydrolase [Pirellulaceae bacterium]
MFPTFARCVALGVVLIQGPMCCGETLESKIRPLIAAHQGTVSVAVKHLVSGEACAIEAERAMPTASLIKLPLMIAAYDAAAAGRVAMDGPILLREEDKVPGSGILTTHFSAGTQLSLRDAIRLMIAWSDNTATNLVVDQVGLQATNQLMDALDCPETKLNSKVYRRDTSVLPERSQRYGLGSTTAHEMVRLLELLHAKRIVNPPSCVAMLDHLFACTDRSKIGRQLPPGVRYANKTGEVSEVRTDAGIMETPAGPIAICVLTNENEDKRFADDNAAHLLCGEIGLLVFQHFNPHVDSVEEPVSPILTIGAAGEMVEAVQRTLNARLNPSPNIGVDGDFGPQTQQAVIRFQKEQGIPADGEVGPSTWQALGTLLSADEAIPDPAAFNSEMVSRAAADSLDGPPFVTCKAWAIADGTSGKVLHGWHEAEVLDPASTTKIMTAYLVTSLAEKEPGILDEILTFSGTADNTEGSSATVRAGEQLPVREALYGLLLPSGNDASVALAEHFGPRLPLSDGTEPGDPRPYGRFVAAMNVKAAELGLRETSYRNTHGLTDEKHKTSARDLAKLAWLALQQPVFHRCVGTIRHAYTVTGPGGYRRTILWKNTNQLLGTEGYDGVKTGTTDAAGACLVSRGTRDGRQLIVVVLGATSSDARYTDSRNLFRWGWGQLGSTSASGN